jgi:hypothetical protein
MHFYYKYKKPLIITLIVLFILLILYIFIYYKNKKFYKNQHIVVSRYNENLEWINQKPFNNHPIIIYNKGINNSYTTNNNVIINENLPNVGRESHTYLHHIIKNYHNLADVTIFLPGSIDLQHKYIRAKNMVEKVQETNNTVFSSVYQPNIVNDQYNFTIDKYLSSHSDNKQINNDGEIQKSNIQPYGLWFNHFFINGEKNEYVSYCGIISVSKNNILQKPKSYYEILLNELSSHHNPEVGHYIERSWYSIFYPYNSNAVFIPYM